MFENLVSAVDLMGQEAYDRETARVKEIQERIYNTVIPTLKQETGYQGEVEAIAHVFLEASDDTYVTRVEMDLVFADETETTEKHDEEYLKSKILFLNLYNYFVEASAQSQTK